ncbi:MAG: hexose kinase, partial [Lachnospiraceae bacterium]|nr:hexose kinase [Lachnospiraceae bacterium]
DFIHLESGFSRINVKIKAGEETEINGRGPHISESEIEALTEKLNRLEDGDTLVLAGSIPPTLPSDMYERILACLEDRKIRFVVDATGDVLRATLRFRPFLVKPNKRELEAFFDVTLDSREELVQYARKMQEQGARNVLVSLGEEGAILVSENGEVYSQTAYEGKLCNSVGAGDSMVAGFLAGMQKGDYETALRLGTAAGSATAFAEGLASKKEIEALYAPGFF